MPFLQDRIEEAAERVAETPIREGRWTKAIENQTAKIPSVFFLNLAIAGIVASAGLRILRQKTTANFIGLWVPTFLLLGLYNKVVKLEGNDRDARA